ncbi:MAG: hypothetical protein F4Y44_03260 [Chloroflexi bacterium]|nr:hypothetical protein [Chloroflexota bacterium]
MLVTDADVPFPVIRALKILQYPIATFDEIGAPVRPDKALMEHVLRYSRVLITRDMGIPSQAYVAQYPDQGLSIALLRWKTSTPKDFQEMAQMILRDGDKWENRASQTPSIISVSRNGSRYRSWSDVPEGISDTRGAVC